MTRYYSNLKTIKTIGINKITNPNTILYYKFVQCIMNLTKNIVYFKK